MVVVKYDQDARLNRWLTKMTGVTRLEIADRLYYFLVPGNSQAAAP